MRTGNVIRDPHGDLWIVVDVHDDGGGHDYHKGKATVEAISFDSENCTAVQRLDDHEREDACSCEVYDSKDEYAGNDPECPDCKGTGRIKRHIKGWKHSKVLATNVKEFILNGVKRQFKL